MANTLANVLLPEMTWVNLYSASGIAVGTKISVQNLTTGDVRVCSKSTAPTSSDGFNLIPPTRTAVNQAADAGAWAMCVSGGAVSVAIST